jgi:hypothetical protein
MLRRVPYSCLRSASAILIATNRRAPSGAIVIVRLTSKGTNDMITPRFVTILVMIFAAAASRLIPHPPNVAPICAMALFGGALFRDKRIALAVPLAALFLSDLVMGFYAGMAWVYGSFVLVVCLGFLLRGRRRALPIAAAMLASSLLFYLITNFGVWVGETLYPHSAAGLAECYIAALPFFGNTLIGDVFYAAALFGLFALAERSFARLLSPEGPAHVAR